MLVAEASVADFSISMTPTAASRSRRPKRLLRICTSLIDVAIENRDDDTKLCADLRYLKKKKKQIREVYRALYLYVRSLSRNSIRKSMLYSRMTRRWPEAWGAVTVAATAGVRPEDVATSGSVQLRPGCGCRLGQPSAAAQHKTKPLNII